jgi:hypothetical protein
MMVQRLEEICKQKVIEKFSPEIIIDCLPEVIIDHLNLVNINNVFKFDDDELFDEEIFNEKRFFKLLIFLIFKKNNLINRDNIKEYNTNLENIYNDNKVFVNDILDRYLQAMYPEIE